MANVIFPETVHPITVVFNQEEFDIVLHALAIAGGMEDPFNDWSPSDATKLFMQLNETDD